MQGKDVVRLEECVENELVVALPGRHPAVVAKDRRQLELVELSVDPAEHGIEIDRLVAGGPYEHQTRPLGHRGRSQRELGRVDRREAITRERLRHQLAVEAVCPPVETTDDATAQHAAALEHDRRPVTANVDERAELPVFSAHNRDRYATAVGGHERTGLGNIDRKAYDDGAITEEPLLLERELIAARVISCRIAQRLRRRARSTSPRATPTADGRSLVGVPVACVLRSPDGPGAAGPERPLSGKLGPRSHCGRCIGIAHEEGR